MKRLVFVILLFFSLTVDAQTVVSNIQDALSLARRNNPNLVAVR